MNDLIESIKKARFIWICGNGGSAATAEHFATDLVKKGYRAICLNTNTAVITMLANDYGYHKIFSKQLALYGNKEDFLITISCSGESKNILEVQEIALAMNMEVYQFKVFEDDRDYETLEDSHLQLVHYVTKAL